MKAETAHHIESLALQWKRAATGLRENEKIVALIDALCAGRFSFAHEAWHGKDGEMASELLLRVWDEHGLPLERGQAIAAVAADGRLPGLNVFLVFAALAKTPVSHDETLSINILPSIAALPQFWDKLDKARGGHAPESIIFEILEHEESWDVDDALMEQAKQKGYRFALDDFNADESDWQRLADFAPYLDFIKLDGPLVRDGLDGDPVLAQTIGRLQKDYPDLQIVAEYVRSDHEAQMLYDMGVTAVQGTRLAASSRSTLRPDPFKK